jgi:drug/metabolite transporter (DMT)-like permease
MTSAALIWVLAAVIAAGAQTARNTLQASLTASLGALGATFVRFVYGLPFGILFCVIAALAQGGFPQPNLPFLAWTAIGAIAQIAATALMLTAMQERSFVVVTVYTKTELVQAALLGALLLGDVPGPHALLAVLVASAGVLLASWPGSIRSGGQIAAFRPALFGIAAGGIFSLAAVGYRGATLALGEEAFVARAGLTLAFALALQTVLMALWFAVRNRATLRAVARAWRPSLAAGFMGAFASFGWFIAFTLTTAANVKMVGLVEIAFAWIVSRRVFGSGLLLREILGMALIVGSIVVVLSS